MASTGIINRYLAVEYFISFMVSFAFFFFIFLINNILLLAEDILGRSVPLVDVLRLLLFALPSVVALSSPFASLLGGLMAVSHFSANSEMMAMLASGISLGRIYAPIALLGIIFSVGSFLVNDVLLPRGTVEFNRLYQQLLFSKPELILDPYNVQRYQDSIIVTGDVSGRVIEDIVIIDPDPEDVDRRIISARRATLERRDDENVGGILSLDLEDVFSHALDQHRHERYQYLVAKRLIYNILLTELSDFVRRPSPREMSSRQVRQEIRQRQEAQRQVYQEYLGRIASARFQLTGSYLQASRDLLSDTVLRTNIYNDLQEERLKLSELEASPPRNQRLQVFRIEHNRKYSLPLGCFFFTLFAFPVGLLARRSGRTVGFGIGLLASVLYWTLLVGGQSIGIRRLEISPLLVMWLPNLVISILGAIVFLSRRLR